MGSCGGSQEPGKGIPVAHLANLPPEVHSRRGRRSHPYGACPLRRVWYGAHEGIGWVPKRRGLPSGGSGDCVDLQPMPPAQLVGDRSQRTVALVGSETEHLEVRLGVDPQRSRAIGKVGPEGILQRHGISQAAASAHPPAQGIEAHEVAAKGRVAHLELLHLPRLACPVTVDLCDDRQSGPEHSEELFTAPEKDLPTPKALQGNRCRL